MEVKDRFSRIEAARKRRASIAAMDKQADGMVAQILDAGDLITTETVSFDPDNPPWHKATSVLQDSDPSSGPGDQATVEVSVPENHVWYWTGGRKVGDEVRGATLDKRFRTVSRTKTGEAREVSTARIVLPPTDKYLEEQEAWDYTQFRLARASVVPLSHEDELVDRDEHGGYIVDNTFRRNQATLDYEAEGIAIEYRRRAEGRQPWMPKSTFRFVMDCDRKRQLQRRQRGAIVGLVKKLGGDPHAPEVAAWVKKLGYEEALLRLEIRAANSGVAF